MEDILAIIDDRNLCYFEAPVECDEGVDTLGLLFRALEKKPRLEYLALSFPDSDYLQSSTSTSRFHALSLKVGTYGENQPLPHHIFTFELPSLTDMCFTMYGGYGASLGDFT